MKSAIKKGDQVIVLTGNSRGQQGAVLQVLPAENRILVEGINKRKHHEKKSKENAEGSIVEREQAIHLSNVMLASRWEERRAKRPKA